LKLEINIVRCQVLFPFHHYHQNVASGFAARFLLLPEVTVDGKLASSGDESFQNQQEQNKRLSRGYTVER
jgi:hypothetical protein